MKESRVKHPFRSALRRGSGEGQMERVKPAERKRNVPRKKDQCVFKEQK